jgi:hypothetical protein
MSLRADSSCPDRTLSEETIRTMENLMRIFSRRKMNSKGNTVVTVLLIVLALFVAAVWISAYDKCTKKRCPAGSSPSLFYKPYRCICEVPAQ